MRISRLLATAAAALLACASAQAADIPAIGSSASALDSAGNGGDKAIHHVRGFLPDLRFTLNGAGGKTVTQDDFKGKVVMLFFGYASCPDICPTTMAQLAQVMQNLGSDANRARIVFVSVDPHRDTPDKLQAYVDVFGKNAVGLTGTARQIADVARRYRVAYQIEKPKAGDTENYEVAHGRGVYIFDPAGRARLLASDANSVQAITDGVKALLK
jgi:protein SCO1/2